jgi:hypothetical protein
MLWAKSKLCPDDEHDLYPGGYPATRALELRFLDSSTNNIEGST